MINKDLLAILACPETKEPVTLAEQAVIDTINHAIKTGQVTNRGHKPVKEPIDGGLIRTDRKYLYPIRDDIPIMLIEEAIPLDSLLSES